MRVCIFCAATPGVDPAYAADTKKFIKLLVADGATIIYGGGSQGLMGVIRDTVKEAKGKAIGVIPNFLLTEERKKTFVSDEELLHFVETLAERKAFMLQNSDAFVALPGGIGTIDEFCEVLALKKLKVINNPLALLNTNGFYNNFISFLHDTVTQKFFTSEAFNSFITSDTPESLVLALKNSPLTVS
jgi:uncharacterized protein (TIGR00730 family)